MKKGIKTLMTGLFWLVALLANANDGVFYVNGNQIVPLKETDIAVTKEVLTITIGNDEFARVDVQYEFTNRGKTKTIDVGFEAAGPYDPGYNGTSFNWAGKHPHIHDFTVEMNGTKLPIRNYVMKESNEEEVPDFTPLDRNVWVYEGDDDCGSLRKKDTDEYESTSFSYAYCFKAEFKEGKNLVHHTYRYRMSSAVDEQFSIPYWLMPAMRWANHQIDDFTLRIKTENTAKHFCMTVDDTWYTKQWKLTSGTGKVRTVISPWAGGSDYVEFSLRNGTYEWHANNFRPKQNIRIVSPECVMRSTAEDFKVGTYYDRNSSIIAPFGIEYDMGEELYNGNTDGIPNKQILRNLPYADRGYVFKDAKLKAYFSKIWWYMPDPNWKQDTSDFTESDWNLINKCK